MSLTSNPFTSIQVKLILFIVIPIILFFILGVFFTISKISTSTEEQLSKNVIIQAKNYAAILESEFNAIASLASVNAGMLENNASLSEDLLLSVLKNTLLSKTQIYGVGVIFEKDVYKKSSIYFYKNSEGEVSPLAINESRNLKKEDWYFETKTTDAINWSEPYIDEALGKNIKATVAVPFHLEDKFAGVSFIDIDLTKLQKHSGLETLTDNAFVITSKKGRFITHPNPDLIMSKTLQDVSREINDPGLVLLNKEVREGKSGQVRVEKLSADIDEPYWLFYAPIRSTGWGFETGLPEREVLAFAKMQIQRAVLGISIILVLAIICVLVVSNSLTRPLKILTDAVKQLADGDLTTSITGITTKDEIGQLSRAFNNMTL